MRRQDNTNWWRNSTGGWLAGWNSVRRQDSDAQTGGGKVPGRVSRAEFGEEMRRRTNWRRNSAGRGSAGWNSARRRDNAPAGEEQCRGRVSRVEFGDEMRRRTGWWRNSAGGGSAGWNSATRRDDAHAGGGTAPGEGQQGGIRRRDETTHKLVEEQCQGRVSRVEFSNEMRQRTSWWRNSAGAGSAGRNSARRRYDAPAGGGTAPGMGQQGGIQ